MYVVRIWEGLGNQMFQYAMAKSLEYRTGQKVYLDINHAYKDSFAWEGKHIGRDYMLDNFKITLEPVQVEKMPAFSFLKQQTIWDKVIFYLGTKMKCPIGFLQDEDGMFHGEYFRRRGNYYVFGWFQQEAYFKDIRKVLLKEFRPKEKIAVPAELLRILKNENTVSIHVRRGDYLKWGNACDSLYYHRAMEYMNQKVEKPIYLVFSDDMEWVRNNLPIQGEVVEISENYNFKDYEELLIMSRCRHQIISNSTFSWWAAWLNQNDKKHVVAPSKWFQSQKNIVPKEWTII